MSKNLVTGHGRVDQGLHVYLSRTYKRYLTVGLECKQFDNRDRRVIEARRRMGGRRGPKRRRPGRMDARLLLRLPTDLLARLREAAQKEERAVAQLVRVFIKQGLDRLERKD